MQRKFLKNIVSYYSLFQWDKVFISYNKVTSNKNTLGSARQNKYSCSLAITKLCVILSQHIKRYR